MSWSWALSSGGEGIPASTSVDGASCGSDSSPAVGAGTSSFNCGPIDDVVGLGVESRLLVRSNIDRLGDGGSAGVGSSAMISSVQQVEFGPSDVNE
jgi:hypothetical protein